MVYLGPQRTDDTGPHAWQSQGWRFWLCRHCYAPKSLHLRLTFARARPVRDHRYLSVRALHFSEWMGW